MKTANKIMMPNGEEIGIDGLYGKITNCLLEVPKRIKLELNNGVLTLKAGSQVIVPNGFEDDGVTPRFDYVDVEQNHTYLFGYNDTRMVFIIPSEDVGDGYPLSNCFSGETAPTAQQYMFWYDTKNNLVKRTQDSGTTWRSGFALPFSIITSNSTQITSINQTFNGLGYIGSTVWVDKGVKGLIPNGRNEDGTLNNIEYVTEKIGINTLTYGAQNYYLALNKYSGAITFAGKTVTEYREEENIVWDTYADVGRPWCFVGECTGNASNVITSFNPKQPFRAVDYSDKAEVSGWSFPSNKYIDLTLNANESTYTAPANGWFAFSKKNASANQSLHVKVNNVTRFHQTQAVTGQAHAFFEQVNKGDVLYIGYSLSGETQCFRFYYCNGEV